MTNTKSTKSMTSMKEENIIERETSNLKSSMMTREDQWTSVERPDLIRLVAPWKRLPIGLQGLRVTTERSIMTETRGGRETTTGSIMIGRGTSGGRTTAGRRGRGTATRRGRPGTGGRTGGGTTASPGGRSTTGSRRRPRSPTKVSRMWQSLVRRRGADLRRLTMVVGVILQCC